MLDRGGGQFLGRYGLSTRSGYTLVGAGAAEGAIDAATMLKPALAQ
jgi:hypothetical protein